MPRAPPPGFYVLALLTVFIWFVMWTRDHDQSVGYQTRADKYGGDRQHGSTAQSVELSSDGGPSIPDIHSGDVISKKIGNETLKAELGRAAWKLFHTTMAQFPDKPTKDQSQALKDYIHLFARLYPCGECAAHFQEILKRYPPQTSSRSTAAAWACFVHNEVNISKGKPTFDCANIGEWYNCGCAEDEKDKKKQADAHDDKVGADDEIEIETDGLTRGG